MTPGAAGGAGVVTGAEYDRQITALESDRQARSAFRELVLKIARPGAALYDFGSGTGMDTRFYAERGFTVTAYDVDAQMCQFLATRCRDLIDSGQVRLEGGGYHAFLAGSGTDSAVDLVTSNFAPLNLIGDLTALFARFHSLTGPQGKVLASVLSPYFVGDLRYGWWWRNALHLWRSGSFAVQGAQAPVVRRSIREFARQSAPYFVLQRVFRGMPSRAGPNAQNGGRRLRYAWLRVTTCRYMFLLFEKRSRGTCDH